MMGSDDKPEQVKGRTDIIVGMHEADAQRDATREAAEREDRKDERAAAQRTIRAWQLTALALIIVLLVLVSGVVGVSVSGHGPGYGDIAITQPGDKPSTATPTPPMEQP